MLHFSKMLTDLPAPSTFNDGTNPNRGLNAKTPKDQDGKPSKEDRYEVYRVACSFAIHTCKYQTKQDKQYSTPYIWTLNIKGITFYGRTIPDFQEAVKHLQYFYKLTAKKRIRFYVHRLFNEFQTIRHFFSLQETFGPEKYKPYYAIFNDGFELYCADAITENSVEDIASDLGIEFIDDLTPKAKRNHHDDLDIDTLKYVENHANVIYKLVENELETYGSIIRIPLTLTGKVRKHINKCVASDASYRNLMKTLTMDFDTFLLMRNAFAGGFTFVNPMYKNTVLKDVTSLDIASAYPSIISTEFFPMEAFVPIEIGSFTEFHENVTSNLYCSVFELTLKNVESKYDYIFSISERNIHPDSENIRILGDKVDGADKLRMTFTNVDWNIFTQLYTYDASAIEIHEFKRARSDLLPPAFVGPVLELYKDKTNLKGIKESERHYRETKVKLNSVYGMMVTNEIQRDSVFYDKATTSWKVESYDTVEEQFESDSKRLDAYNKNKWRTMFYPWGVWVTAYARSRLFSVILKTGEDFVYCDTDSVKVRKYDKYKTMFDNDYQMQLARIDRVLRFDNAFVREDFTPKAKDGKEKVIGAFEYEYTYSKFKALKAKQYVGIVGDTLEVTCAGLPKKALSTYLLSFSNNNDEALDNFNSSVDIPGHATGVKIVNFVNNSIKTYITSDDGSRLELNIPACTYYETRGFSLAEDGDTLSNHLTLAEGKLKTITY